MYVVPTMLPHGSNALRMTCPTWNCSGRLRHTSRFPRSFPSPLRGRRNISPFSACDHMWHSTRMVFSDIYWTSQSMISTQLCKFLLHSVALSLCSIIVPGPDASWAICNYSGNADNRDMNSTEQWIEMSQRDSQQFSLKINHSTLVSICSVALPLSLSIPILSQAESQLMLLFCSFVSWWYGLTSSCTGHYHSVITGPVRTLLSESSKWLKYMSLCHSACTTTTTIREEQMNRVCLKRNSQKVVNNFPTWLTDWDYYRIFLWLCCEDTKLQFWKLALSTQKDNVLWYASPTPRFCFRASQ